MKAKLIINEIRRDRSSGIAALGLGKINICEAYEKLIEECPECIARLMPCRFANNFLVDSVNEVTKVFECSKDQILYTDVVNLPLSYSVKLETWIQQSAAAITVDGQKLETYDPHKKTLVKFNSNTQISERLSLAILSTEKTTIENNGKPVVENGKYFIFKVPKR